ncbi:hypothetical protein GE061_001705 [Apolygus lucorum]|uniref:FP protein C-terminal domain-containing protein n=1 Tax=Apolygus lucorum TaxID=248454 RepID=A0A6A4K9C8_APOLU|nr:hypothetical protein GE061_001705 [Apolygus lucorum]
MKASNICFTCGPCKTEFANTTQMDEACKSKDINSLIDVIKSLVESNKNFTKALNDYSSVVEENTQAIKNIDKQMADLTKKIDSVIEDNVKTDKRLSELENKSHETEQALLDNEIEIRNFPIERDENALDIVQKVGKTVNIDILESDINRCYRTKGIPGNSSPPVIIVDFTRHRLKQQLIAKLKARKSALSNRDFGYNDGPKETIYINNGLTYYNRKLLRDAKIAKREKNYKYLWFSNRKLLIKKDDNSVPIVLKNVDDIRHLL